MNCRDNGKRHHVLQFSLLLPSALLSYLEFGIVLKADLKSGVIPVRGCPMTIKLPHNFNVEGEVEVAMTDRTNIKFIYEYQPIYQTY